MYSQKVLKGIYQRIVEGMSGMKGISIELNPNFTPCWIPDKKKICMPTQTSFASNEEEGFKYGRGSLVHESSHVLFLPNFTPIIKKLKRNTDDFHEFSNVFADVNNEYKVGEIWKHLKILLIEKNLAIMKARPYLKTIDNPFIQILGRLQDLGMEYPPDFNPLLKNFCEQTVKKFKEKDIYSANGEDLIKFTMETFKRWEKIQEKHNMEKMAYSKNAKKLLKELGEAIKYGNSEGQEEIKKELEKMKDPGKLVKEDDNSLKTNNPIEIPENNYNKLSLEELKKMLQEKQKERVETDKGMTPGWGNEDSSCIKKVESRRPNGEEKANIDEKKAYEEGKKINRQLKRKISLMDDFAKRHRTGRIDIDEIRKQIATCGRITTETVFERNDAYQRGGELAVEILVDCSGSMSGKKIIYAKQVFATLAYALDKIPNIHFALTAYTTQGNPVDIQIKRFNENFDISNLRKIDAEAGNMDGFNIRTAIKRLNVFRNIKKILIVISDGQPAYSQSGLDGIEDTKRAVDLAGRFGIKVIGIGIEGCTEESLRYCYPTNFLFKELSPTLSDDLTNLILAQLGQRDKMKLVKASWDL